MQTAVPAPVNLLLLLVLVVWLCDREDDIPRRVSERVRVLRLRPGARPVRRVVGTRALTPQRSLHRQGRR
jgi:hypothetical protein